MRKFGVMFCGLLVLTACSSVQPKHKVMDNSDLLAMNSCDMIETNLAESSKKLDVLKNQKLGADAGNGLNVAAAALSLNPLAFFDHTSTTDLEAAIENYSERVETLTKRAETHQCKLPEAVKSEA